MRVGNNIRQRKDGKYEARYEKSRDENGKIVYGYCYANTYEEVERKKNEALALLMPVKELNLLILGNGEHGAEVYGIAKKLNIFRKIDFLDDFNKKGNSIGKIADARNLTDKYSVAIPAVGDNTKRTSWMLELIKDGYIIPTFIHSGANVSSDVEIGPGTVVCAGASIGFGAKIGKGCIIDSGAVIGRHAAVPDWTLVNCGEIYRKEEK